MARLSAHGKELHRITKEEPSEIPELDRSRVSLSLRSDGHVLIKRDTWWREIDGRVRQSSTHWKLWKRVPAGKNIEDVLAKFVLQKLEQGWEKAA